MYTREKASNTEVKEDVVEYPYYWWLDVVTGNVMVVRLWLWLLFFHTITFHFIREL